MVPPGDVIQAAGGVLWRRENGVVEVALVHRPRYDDWSLPKGKLDPGERHLGAARREVYEETGARTRVGRRLGDSRYLVLSPLGPVAKVVRWWALECAGGQFQPGPEVDALHWLSPAAALALLRTGHDAAPLRLFAQGPAQTTLVLLVRHASAGRRSGWQGPDERRPLDAKGRRQAAALAGALADYDPVQILAAPLQRCQQSVTPLAAALGLPVLPEPRLADTAHALDPTGVSDYVRSLGRADGPVVACSQGDTVTAVVQRLAGRGRLVVPAGRTRKGAAWALSVHDGRLVDADLLASPR